MNALEQDFLSYFDRNGLNHAGVDKLLPARKLVYDCAQAEI
ncbi:hypothetical protein HSISS2_1599 [Streptococcus sp. HSISS2]|nr:hypothetical protein HSISS2_2077 [Streptococcus sp. HSISS2]EQC72174.1 hypothetical protein HSISS2_1599 [Streptococcus sp. HSISS2]